MKYNCYILTFGKKIYYIYVKDKTLQVYGTNNLQKPVLTKDELELLADVTITGITDKSIHLVYKKDMDLYGTRNTNFDIKA